MATEYETFVNTLDDLKQGQEIDLTVRDTETFESRKVRAVVSASKLPAGDILRIRFSRGLLHPQPWAIRIVKELGGLID